MDARKLAWATVSWLFLQFLMLLGMWSILLFAGNPSQTSWIENLIYLLTEQSELRPAFIGSLVVMLVSGAMISTYLARPSASPLMLWVLFAIATANSIFPVTWLSWDNAIPFILAPVFAFLTAAYSKPSGGEGVAG